MEARAIRSVAVVGGGVVGWSAAAALRRRLPMLDVSILPLPPARDALADRLPSTLPSILGFHADLALGEADAVLRTGSAYRLGTLFSGWGGDAADYVHSYGRHGQPLGAASFHLHWARAAQGRGVPGFDAFSPAAVLARDDRFAPADDARAPYAGYEYGLQIDVERYRTMMRAFALHVGVREIAGALDGAVPDASGGIERLALDGGREHRADLYVDCTGPAALLRATLDDVRADWSRWLPCDRVLIAQGPPPAELPALDRVSAVSSGWRWSAALPARTVHGIAYAATHASDAKAARQLKVATGVEPGEDPIRIAAGTRPEPWRRNCVAIGDAATSLEPLEWCNLHLAHSAIDRLIAMLPDREFAAVELADYNRQHRAEAERVRDFVALHYATASRGEPFWRAAAAVEPPASLAHTLTLFRERGRLPFYEEETFARDSWLAVLFGQGVVPRRIDPLVDAVPPAQSLQAMGAMRAALAAGVTQIPKHAAFLAMQRKALTR